MPILWKPMKNFCSFLRFVNLTLSSILVECNSAFKMYTKITYVNLFYTLNFIYLDVVENG